VARRHHSLRVIGGVADSPQKTAWVSNGEYSSTIHLLHFLEEGFDIPLVAFICFVKSIDEKESVFELPVEVHKELYEFAGVGLCLVYLVHEKRL
jgi:hypothetical protein